MNPISPRLANEQLVNGTSEQYRIYPVTREPETDAPAPAQRPIVGDRPARVIIGGHTIHVDLPNGVRVGDPQWEHEVAKRIAQGIQDAFETFPPRSRV